MLRFVLSIAIIGVAISALFYHLWRDEVETSKRLRQNSETLLGDMRRYKVSDSLNAASVGILKLKVSEFRKYRAADAALIRQMQLRLNRVNSVASVATIGRYDFGIATPASTRMVNSLNLAYRDNYIDFEAIPQSDSLRFKLLVRDTIVQVLHRVERFRFLGIRFGTKGVRQEIVSRNPHTQIAASHYLVISEK